jgi:hypothetical protein
MGQIVLGLMNFDKGPMNNINVILKLWKLCS